MPKINLAQETMRNQVIAGRRRMVYLFSIIVLAVVGLVYLGLFLLTRNTEGKVADVEQRIATLEQQLKTRDASGREIKAFSMRLVNIESLLSKHVRWSTALGELEKLVLPSVKVLGLSGGTDAKEVLMDVQVPNIEAAADLVMSLEDNAKSNETFFSNVTAQALGLGSGTTGAQAQYSTKLKFGVKPEGLLDKSLTATSAVTATDDVNSLTP
jgi:Tfp pilus assembly protein PilN